MVTESSNGESEGGGSKKKVECFKQYTVIPGEGLGKEKN